MNRKLIAPMLVGALLTIQAIAGTTFAETIDLNSAMLLSELISSEGTIESGDIDFSNFGYAATGDMPSSDRVNVIPLLDDDGNYGIRFQGGFVDLPGKGASDALISYDVTVTAPDLTLSGAHLSGNIVENDGSGSVTETFLPIFDLTDEVLRIPTGDNRLSDGIMFPETVAYTELRVQKNILMIATGEDQVDMSFVDQSFAQVPEPTGVVLLMLGLFSIGCIIKRT